MTSQAVLHGATSGTATVQASAVSGASVLTLPAATDTIAVLADVTGGIATHAALTATHGVSGAIVGTTDTQELSAKTLNASVGKGTWTASGTWTLPAFTAGDDITVAASKAIKTATGLGNTVLLQAYDTDTGPAYTTFGTLTAGTTPSFKLSNITMEGTWLASGTVTLPAFTLGGAVTSNGQSFSGTIADLGTVTTIDINGGTLDGVTIGGTVRGAISCTTLDANGGVTLGDAVTDAHTVNGFLAIIDDSQQALIIARSGGGDRMRLGGAGAGSGAVIDAANSAETDYEPLSFITEHLIVQARTGAGTAAEITRTTSTGFGVFCTPGGIFHVTAGASGNAVMFDRSTAGVALQLLATHSDNTNGGSNCYSQWNVGGASGGDPYIQFGVTALTTWTVGIDNSDSDKFKISESGTLGTNDYLTIDASGIISTIKGVIGNSGGNSFSLYNLAATGGTEISGGSSINLGANIGLYGESHGATPDVMKIRFGTTDEAIFGPSAGASRLISGIRIGADSTNNLLDDASTGAGTATLYIGNASINVTSDARIKRNIHNTERDALAIMRNLRVVDHTWDDPTDRAENNRNSRGAWTGLIAQEAIKHVPWLVNKPLNDADRWHADWSWDFPLTVRAVQQLDESVESLQRWKAKAEVALAEHGITVH